MPEHQIPSLAGNRFQPGMAQNCPPRIFRWGQVVEPLLQAAVESGNTAERSLIGRRIGER